MLKISSRVQHSNQHCFIKITYIYAIIIYICAIILPIISHADSNKYQLKKPQQNITQKEHLTQVNQQQYSYLFPALDQQISYVNLTNSILRNSYHKLDILHRNMYQYTHSISQLQPYLKGQQTLLVQPLNMVLYQDQYPNLQFIISNTESQLSKYILSHCHLNHVLEKNLHNLSQNNGYSTMKKYDQQQKVFLQPQKNHQILQKAKNMRQKNMIILNTLIMQDRYNLKKLSKNEMHLCNSITPVACKIKVHIERKVNEVQKIHKHKAKNQSKDIPYSSSKTKWKPMVRITGGGLGQPTGQVLWPVCGRTMHYFGEQQCGELYWKGLVITANEGSEVKAIVPGRVLLANWMQGYGLIVVIEHGNGDMSLYGYNRSTLVNVGDQVRAGQPIALVGNYGDQGTAALYFEIRRQGKAVNPIPWLVPIVKYWDKHV